MIRTIPSGWILLILAGCCFPRNGADDKPANLIIAMREFAEKGMWDSYWECISEEGKGWFIETVAHPIALKAYCREPRDYSGGERSRQFIKKYGLERQRMEVSGNESLQEARCRIAGQMGDRGPEFCRELFLKMEFPFFPEAGKITVVEQTGKRAILLISPDNQYVVSRKSGHWRLDGDPKAFEESSGR